MSQRRMFEAKCTACGKSTTVPFNPTKGKPVYCRTCFSKHRTDQRERSDGNTNLNMKNAWAGTRAAKFPIRKNLYPTATYSTV